MCGRRRLWTLCDLCGLASLAEASPTAAVRTSSLTASVTILKPPSMESLDFAAAANAAHITTIPTPAAAMRHFMTISLS